MISITVISFGFLKYIWGKPKNEVQIVCDIFNIKLDSAKEVSKDDEYVCVDLNGYNQMNQEIVTLDNLVEIIDHHAKSVYLPQYKKRIPLRYQERMSV